MYNTNTTLYLKRKEHKKKKEQNQNELLDVIKGISLLYICRKCPPYIEHKKHFSEAQSTLVIPIV